MATRVARYPNVYGPFGTYVGGREKALAAICRTVIEAQLSGNHEIEIWGDGEQTRSFMYTDDCVRGTEDILHSNILKPLHLLPLVVRDLVRGPTLPNENDRPPTASHAGTLCRPR